MLKIKKYLLSLKFKKVIAKITLFFVLCNILNFWSIFFVLDVNAGRLNEHRIVDIEKWINTQWFSSNKLYNYITNTYTWSVLWYGANRLKNPIITTSSWTSFNLPITNPYNLNIYNLDLSINSSISWLSFTTWSLWYDNSITLSWFVLGNDYIDFKTNLTSYSTWEIYINYFLTEEWDPFIYTWSISVPFENFNPVDWNNFTSLSIINSLQISNYLTTWPIPTIEVLDYITWTWSESGSWIIDLEEKGELKIEMIWLKEIWLDKISEEIYVELRNNSWWILIADEDIEVKIETTSEEEKISLDGKIWSSSLTTYIKWWSTRVDWIYMRWRKTKTTEIKWINPSWEYREWILSNIKIRNKLDISSQDKEVIKWDISSKISFILTDPRLSRQTKAKWKLNYTWNPLDWETIKIDKVIYEFDNNGIITNGNVLVWITDTADSTFIKLRDLINNWWVASVYTTLLTDTKTMYIESRESWYKWNTIETTETSSVIELDGTTLWTEEEWRWEISYTNEETIIRLEVEWWIVSLSKTEIESVTWITLQRWETLWEMYFIADNVSWTWRVLFKYEENGTEWIESEQIIKILEPRIKIEWESNIQKINIEKELEISLKDITKVNKYISKWWNTVKMTSNSIWWKFSLTKTGVYTEELLLNYEFWDSTKTIWYKDSEESVLINGLSQTEIRAELFLESNNFGIKKINVYNDIIWDYYYNNVWVKSNQFNKWNILDWIMLDISPYVDFSNLEAYKYRKNVCENKNIFLKSVCAYEYNFDYNNLGVKVYKLNTTSDINNTMNPENIKNIWNELNSYEYNLIKSIDSEIVEITTQTWSENSLFLYEYTLSWVLNDIVKISNYNYWFSTSSWNIFAIWNWNDWINLWESNNESLTWIPKITSILSNFNNYINSNKIYIISSSKDKSTFENNVSLYVDYIKLRVVDNSAPELTINSVENWLYHWDKKITYSAKDYDWNDLSLSVEYSIDDWNNRSVATLENTTSDYIINNYNSIYRQLEVKSTNIWKTWVVVWRSITDLPYINLQDVKIRIIVNDSYLTTTSNDFTIFNMNNIQQWSYNSSPVIVQAGDPYKVNFVDTIKYNDENTFVTIKAEIVDMYENRIIWESLNLEFRNEEWIILTWIVDNNDWTYSIEYPVTTIVSQIDLFNLNKTDENKLNSKKILLSWNTISNWYIDIFINWTKTNKDEIIYTWEDWNFLLTLNDILPYWKHKMKLKVTPMWWSLENTTTDIFVIHNGISDEFWLNTDVFKLTTQWTIWETDYDLSITNLLQDINIADFNNDRIYSTNYPVIIWSSKPNTLIKIFNGDNIVWKVYTDKYWIFEYNSRHKLSNGIYTYTFEIDEFNRKNYTFEVNDSSSINSINVINIISNKSIYSDNIIILWFGKSKSVIEVSLYSWWIYEKIWNWIIDDYWKFEYELKSNYLVNWVNKIKLKNKETWISKYIWFDYNEISDCNKVECFWISNIWLSKNNYLSINWFSKKTNLNKSVIYIYARRENEEIIDNKIIWVVSTNSNWLFNFNSLEKFEYWNYIFTIKSSLWDYKKTIYIDTSILWRPYIHNIKNIDNWVLIHWYNSSTWITLKYKNLDLNNINFINYDLFENLIIKQNNNWYFTENIYTNNSWSLIIKSINNENITNTSVINN